MNYQAHYLRLSTFNHFKKTELNESSLADPKIRLSEELVEDDPPRQSSKSRISLLDD